MTLDALAAELRDGGAGGSYDLEKAAQIHTRVVAMASESIDSVIRNLGLLDRGNEVIDPAEILQALTNYAETEAERRLLEVLASASKQLLEVAGQLPSEQAAALGVIVGRLQGARTLGELRDILGPAERSAIPEIAEGARYARSILDDGENTIYNPETSHVAEAAGDPDDPPQERNRLTVQAIASDDVSGAIGGAVGGALFGLFGALPGAAAGAVTSSVGTLAKRALKKLRSR